MAQILLQGPQPAFAYEQLTVSSTSKALTDTVYQPFESTNNTTKQAKYALITTETDSVRFRLDGTAPTASVGHLLLAGSTLELMSITQVRNIRFIRTSGDATINVTYFGS